MRKELVVSVLACLLAHGAARDVTAQDLVISNARIIVGNGTVLNQGSVVVRAGRIVSVAEGAASGGAGPNGAPIDIIVKIILADGREIMSRERGNPVD